MKKILTAVLAAALCLSLLCACGEKKESAASQAQAQGNASAFNLDESHLKSVLACAWVNQDNLYEKIKFADDLSFTHYIKDEQHKGRAVLDERGGMLTFTYEDNYRPEKGYVWVDSKSNVNANTWYVDGGTFAFGGVTFIKDMEF